VIDKRLTKEEKKKIKPANQGGGPNYLGKQETVTVPKKWLSDPDHVVAELAYITPREQKILLDANIYGSLKGKPNKGPGGIMSLQGDMGSVGSGSSGGTGGNEGDDYETAAYGAPDTIASITSSDTGGHSKFDNYYEPPNRPTPPQYTGINIHGGPTASYGNLLDEVALTGSNKVRGVDYSAVGPGSQYQKNINLSNQLLNTPYSFDKTPFMGLNLLGSTIGKFGHDKNTKFFVQNSIGGKINPLTGEAFGYGIDGYKEYMKQRQLGNVGAYGNPEQGQNAINERSGAGDTNQGIMNINNVGDADNDGDVDQDDFIFKYFDKTGETLQAGAGGVQDLMTSIRKRISNLFS